MRTTSLFHLSAWLPRLVLSVTANTWSWLVIGAACFLSTHGSPDSFAIFVSRWRVSAVALDVIFLLVVEALLVLFLFLCQFLGVISLLSSMHELAFTYALDVLALLSLSLHRSEWAVHRLQWLWRCPAPPL